MSEPFPGAGLSTEQAPPLSIPVSFFLTAPVALAAAGLWLLVDGVTPTARWLPGTLALTHLGTLGFLAAVMFGALYQMTPVVAGSPVPFARLAHLVHAALVLGVAALVWGFATGSSVALWHAVVLLGAAVTLFVLPVGVALARAPTRHDTVTGMRLAVAALSLLVVAGLVMTLARTGTRLPFASTELFAVHVALGLVAWVGGLITSVSWQVVPMFYLAPEVPRWSRRLTLGCLALALSSPLTLLWAERPAWLLPALVAPAAASVWALEPALTLAALSRRRRKRVDRSKDFWQAGLVAAPVTLTLAVLAVLLDHPRWAVLFGWLGVWGWAGAIVLGMLTRIVPFLVWFHRFSALVGKVPVPPMRRMIPEGLVRLAGGLHLLTTLVGVAAIVLGEPVASRALGLCLLATAAVLGAALLRVLRLRPERPAEP